MEELRERIAKLSPEQRRLLEHKLQQKVRDRIESIASDTLHIRRNHAEALPLSFAQQRLWFLSQLDEQSTQYNIPYAVELKGRLSVEALSQTLRTIVARHEALRTTFSLENGVAVQRVGSASNVELKQIDLSHAPAEVREQLKMDTLRQEAKRRFDLRREVLIRAALVKLQADEFVLLLTIHHIAADAWSFGVLFRELGTLYEAFSKGAQNPLPPLDIQYADFSIWQREWLSGETLGKQLNYWKRKLGGLAVLDLPTDNPRPAKMTYEGRRLTFTLPAALSLELKQLARKERVSEYMLLLAAFKVLLRRYSGQTDIAVGSPIANRNRIELEKLIGFFVNTLVLRTDLGGNLTFRELLSRVRETCLDAYAHQELPFEKLVEELQPQRDPSRNPFFQTAFVLQNTPIAPLKLTNLVITPLPLHDGTAKFDLTLMMHESRGQFSGILEYRSDLFEDDTIRRMAGHLQTLLTGIVAQPETAISKLPLLSDLELHQVKHWADTKTPYPDDVPIHKLFEDVAARTPEATAVSFEGQRLSYRTLNERANQLARVLQKHGVRPKSPVGLCMERSPDLIIAVLGILKAGGGYVPLDPSYPRERLALMVRDSGAPVIIAEGGAVAALPNVETPVLEWEAITAEMSRMPADNMQPGVGGNDLAYIIYTSGSTGQPKGICIPQKAVNRLVLNTNYVQLNASARVAQVSNASFDAATFEFWGALLNGGELVIIRKDIALSPRDFIAALREHRISAMFLTTALFNLLIDHDPAAFSTLEHLMFGGEACDPRRVRACLAGGPPKRLLHVYGPTEVTTFSTWHLVENVPEDAQTVPIGKPLANTEAYVLDRDLNPVPPGIPGELYLGGDGLAHGYLNRPELTAEKFIPHPLSTEPGARLYKSGDIVRYLPNGDIEFIGRRDHQVKIRGFRIELGEIEAALLEHDAVKQCTVIAREETRGDRRIVAYVVLKDGAQAPDFRKFLSGRMPEYMIPSAIMTLASLPLNENGKVDRKALPAPDYTAAEQRNARTLPRSLLESQIVEIWEDVLGVKGIGITDDFFHLGGHSLLAVQMMDRVEQICGRKLPLTALFANATIENLSRELLNCENRDGQRPYMAIQASGQKRRLFFLHGDVYSGGLYCINLARCLGPDQPVYAIHPHGMDGRVFDMSIEEMAAEQLKVIRSIDPHGPYLLGGFCASACVAFEVAQQLRASGATVERLIMVDVPPLRHDWRLIRAAVNAFGAFHLSAAERRELYSTCLKRYARLREFARSGVREQINKIGRKLSSRRNSVPAQEKTVVGVRNMPRDIALAYQWAIAGYAPRRYPGDVSLIFSDDVHSDGDATLGWGDVTRSADVYRIPGDHQTCRTKHNKEFAEQVLKSLSGR
ncbi:MAG TPA: amino acid adenylation domain-containing protein [Planctomycetota bacterium]|nr:amino acid adenylation domain-containing protein [Planctomycetota bacterium]